MGLKGYIAKRLAYTVVLILMVITVNFILFNLMPGDPLQRYIGTMRGKMTEEWWNELKRIYGLDRPPHERYIQYVFSMLTFQFGRSHTAGRTTVTQQLMMRLPATLRLMGFSAIISIAFGILLGVVAAYKRGGTLDTGLVTASLITYSLPVFWLGWLVLYFFGAQLDWFPISHKFPVEWIGNWPTNPLAVALGYLYHMILPAFTLFIFSVGGWILLARACVLETITEDYVLTARAKGVKERSVLLKHVLKNASLPLITSVALTFGFLITGAIITETVFTYEGMGRWIWSSISTNDLPVLQAVFYVIALLVIIANFIADLIYGVIDPRIKYG
jgi:peptide/nickel transport system permease protein